MMVNPLQQAHMKHEPINNETEEASPKYVFINNLNSQFICSYPPVAL